MNIYDNDRDKILTSKITRTKINGEMKPKTSYPKRKVKIFDTTLRDGEQSPGCSMTSSEKERIAFQLARLNVDIIEAGFAASSEEDFQSIVSISKSVQSSTICSLARAKKEDIDAAAKSLDFAKRKRIHTFIATSPIHMRYKLTMTEDQVLNKAVESVSYAKKYVDEVQFSSEDAGRSNRNFLVQIFTEVIKAGATTINIPDTVGYMTPQEFGELIEFLCQNIPNIHDVDVSVHCHNDLGLATANTLLGLLNGATQAEVTVNGIGERAGNAALEEVVMTIKTRYDHLLCTNIQTEELLNSSRAVSFITGSFVQANKAIVGKNAFAHEAGIHQDGMLKSSETYEIINPKDVGWQSTDLVLGKHSGRRALKHKLDELSFPPLSTEDMDKLFKAFKDLVGKKHVVLDNDIRLLVKNILDIRHEPVNYYHLEDLSLDLSLSKNQTIATVSLSSKNGIQTEKASDIGVFNTICKAINQIVSPLNIVLLDYNVTAATGEKDAQGVVILHVEYQGKEFVGKGTDLDILVASTQAYIHAINRILEQKLS